MIETSRLRLIPCETRHFEAILAGGEQLKRMLGIAVFDGWFGFPGVAGIEAVGFVHEHLRANPDELDWWTYLFVHVEDGALIGTGGFKGKADESGMVEIGYAIVPAYMGRGLVDHAFAHVKRVDAHTLAERNASTGVLEKVGMRVVGAAHDPDVGAVWRWSLRRADLRKVKAPS